MNQSSAEAACIEHRRVAPASIRRRFRTETSGGLAGFGFGVEQRLLGLEFAL